MLGTRIVAGVTNETFNRQQLGPGGAVKNFEYESIATFDEFDAAAKAALSPYSGQSLGGTDGGFDINITATKRQRQVDGATVRFKGDSVIDEWTCEMSTTLKEFIPGTIQAAFPTAEFTLVGSDITAMRIRTSIEDEDYLDNVALILSTDYGWLMIVFFNVLGEPDGSINTENQGEGGIPIKLTGHNNNFDDMGYAPAEIWMVDRSTNGIIRSKVAAGGGD